MKLLAVSILQLMKCVAYCAVASACLAPMFDLWLAGVVDGGSVRGLVSIGLFEAIVIPLAWVGLTFCLIRNSAWRDALITTLLLCSICVALAFALWTLGTYTIPAYRQSSNGVEITSLCAHVIIILILVAGALLLVRQLARGFARAPSA